jgi:hypothetical protein
MGADDGSPLGCQSGCQELLVPLVAGAAEPVEKRVNDRHRPMSPRACGESWRGQAPGTATIRRRTPNSYSCQSQRRLIPKPDEAAPRPVLAQPGCHGRAVRCGEDQLAAGPPVVARQIWRVVVAGDPDLVVECAEKERRLGAATWWAGRADSYAQIIQLWSCSPVSRASRAAPSAGCRSSPQRPGGRRWIAVWRDEPDVMPGRVSG